MYRRFNYRRFALLLVLVLAVQPAAGEGDNLLPEDAELEVSDFLQTFQEDTESQFDSATAEIPSGSLETNNKSLTPANVSVGNVGTQSTDTECHLTDLICSTAFAVSKVKCDTDYEVNWCVGVGSIGGHGYSPVGLSGKINWNGRVACYLDCDDTSTWLSDVQRWPGFMGHWGEGSMGVENKETVASLSCVSYSMGSSVTARSYAYPLVENHFIAQSADESHWDYERQC